MNKKRLEFLTDRFAVAKVKTSQSQKKEIEEICSLSLESILNPLELLELKAEIEKFEKGFLELDKLNFEYSKNIEKNIKNKRQELEELKRQKTSVVSKIAETYAENGDATSFYGKLLEVDSKLSQINSFLYEVEAQKQYPTSEKNIEKAKEVFSLGIELVKKLVKFRNFRERYSERLRNVQLLLKVVAGELFETEYLASSKTNALPKIYGQTLPERALELTWEELSKEANEKIEELIKK